MMGITFLLVCVFVIAFVISAKNGQFDDLITPAHRILNDDNEDNQILVMNKNRKQERIKGKQQ